MIRLIVTTTVALLLVVVPAGASKLIDNLTAGLPYKNLGQSTTVRDLLLLAKIGQDETYQLVTFYMVGQLYGRDYHRRCDKVVSKRQPSVFKRVARMNPKMTLTKAIAKADRCTVNRKREKRELGTPALDKPASEITDLLSSRNPNSSKDRHILALLRNYMIGVLDGSYQIRGCTGPRKKMFADMVAIAIATPVILPEAGKLNFNEIMGIAIAAKCKDGS